MRYFVNGATGFLGSELARQLSHAGHTPVALVRDPDRAQPLVDMGCEVRQGDITDQESLRAAMGGTDGIFHVAGWYKLGQRDPTPARTVNVEGTRNVLEVMAELDVPRGVYTSTLAVNSDTGGCLVDESYRFGGRHLSHYDQSKWEAHELVARPLMDHGLPLTVVMPGVIYGPGDHSPIGGVIEGFLRGRPTVVPAGAAYCWAHVEDVATAHRLAMEHGRPGEDYIVAGPPATMMEALRTVARIVDRAPPRLQALAGMLALTSRLLESTGRFSTTAAAQAEVLRVAAGVTYLGDNAKAREELGYAPRSLEEGLGAYIPDLVEELAESADRGGAQGGRLHGSIRPHVRREAGRGRKGVRRDRT